MKVKNDKCQEWILDPVNREMWKYDFKLCVFLMLKVKNLDLISKDWNISIRLVHAKNAKKIIWKTFKFKFLERKTNTTK